MLDEFAFCPWSKWLSFWRRLFVPKPMLRAELHIQDWVQSLAELLAAQFTQDNVQQYILQHGILPSSLEPFTFFSSERYTRNLIFKNNVLECLALRWDFGQSSSIHDHNDKLGWMSLASGRLFENDRQIHALQRQSSKRSCC
jgi:cysteine dioxygenase